MLSPAKTVAHRHHMFPAPLSQRHVDSGQVAIHFDRFGREVSLPSPLPLVSLSLTPSFLLSSLTHPNCRSPVRSGQSHDVTPVRPLLSVGARPNGAGDPPSGQDKTVVRPSEANHPPFEDDKLGSCAILYQFILGKRLAPSYGLDVHERFSGETSNIGSIPITDNFVPNRQIW